MTLDGDLARARDDLAATRRQILAERRQADDRAALVRRQAEGERAAAVESLRQLRATIDQEKDRLAALRAQVVQTEDVLMLQESGIYEYRHRLADAVAYKARLAEIKDTIRTAARNDTAVKSVTSWTVNGSATAGRKMVRETARLMLRAYNAEADACLRTMKPHRLASCIDRLDRARDTIARLGSTMDIHINSGYHKLRVAELELTADHLAKVEEDKERIRAEREAAREEAALRKEIERERARLAKEDAHWAGVQEQMRAVGDDVGLAAAETRRAEIADAFEQVESREANVRTGWVYVISNIGAFGEQMVKIGMTRRLDPTERVRELGDASVPFRFDTHALVFSSDAVSLEGRLHREFADRRVNQVNLRREFFYATPTEVLQVLKGMDDQHVLEYTEDAEAAEWRASRSHPLVADSPPQAEVAEAESAVVG